MMRSNSTKPQEPGHPTVWEVIVRRIAIFVIIALWVLALISEFMFSRNMYQTLGVDVFFRDVLLMSFVVITGSGIGVYLIEVFDKFMNPQPHEKGSNHDDAK